jgi:hypothetical protein
MALVPITAYPSGKKLIYVWVYDNKLPMGMKIEKLHTYREYRVWVWDYRTHTRIPILPSNIL